MAHPQKKATTEQIIAAYRETGSVWKAAKSLGMAGQTVHERLRAADVKLVAARWTEDEVAELRALVEHVTIGEIARRLGRPYAGVAGKISELGVGTRAGNRVKVKIPRGAGYDKTSLLGHVKALDANPETPITRYARANGLAAEMLIQSIEKHFPDWWATYKRAHSDLPEKACTGCGLTFLPTTGKQAYCTRKCATASRVDRDYFGGRRSTTIGLAAGMCQICERKPARSLSSHHVFGKENDPENTALIALCSGCHQLVTLLGGRDWTREKWESLISFAYMRKHGAAFMSGDIEGDLYVYVEMEIEPYDEDDDSAELRGARPDDKEQP